MPQPTATARVADDALPLAALADPGASMWPPLGAAAVGLPALQEFRALMAAEGHTVQVARLCFDRLYAYERIALAHAGSDAALRGLALRLFQACHGGGAARAGNH